MRSIRIVGVATVAAMSFMATVGAGAALAAPPNVVINSPGADAPYESYPTISGSITQEGPDPQLNSASVALSSNDGWTSENQSISYTRGGGGAGFTPQGNASVTFSWAPKPKYNGRYTVTVTGAGRSGGFGGQTEQQNIVSRSFYISIDPVKPTGVAASMDDDQRVTVTWSPNPEPDLVGYQVYRSYQNGNPAPVGNPVAASNKPTFTDDLSGRPQGQYKYQVVAVRRARTCASASQDPACTEGRAGPASNYSSAVTVRGTGATTTTTTKKPGTGTGGGSGSGSGSGTGSGSGSGSGSGTGSGSGSASSGGRSAPRNTGGFAPGGNVDLSQFGGLLGGTGRSGANGGAVDEGTYDGELPYDGSEQAVGDTGDDDSLITIGGASLPAPSDDWVKFIGAGSFVTALLVHVLWFKQQVDALPLEAID